MRITEKDLKNLMDTIGMVSNGYPINRTQAEERGLKHYLKLEKSYSGYCLRFTELETGTIHTFDSLEYLSTKEMAIYLKGIIRGLDFHGYITRFEY